MRKMLMKWLLALSCFLLAACAVITVNVYFPEKAAKDAYKSLDEMLLKPGPKSPGAAIPAAPAPPAEQKEQAKPQSRLLDHLPSLALVTPAFAADNEADALAIEMSSMPEVLKAYTDMRQRLPRIQQLFTSGGVGLTNQGLVSVRDKTKLSPQDESLVTAENQSRKTVVAGMAKAILKLGKQKESKAALNQVMPKAAATFAETRQEEAQPGWWIQLPNGKWVQK
ncbi:DUF1318 domain-containing protein [Geomonas sp.]|uniref:DUF1318 domain-containing protein n=1 Tax=Geomonas sp. TaxID=2651584 RepID=UPI002B47C58C|nr:DUF1318 domain-containing protein [Geomonas sp.]HJV36624.1 DUF1318 domain-containing protein [Geomonas sp.]